MTIGRGDGCQQMGAILDDVHIASRRRIHAAVGGRDGGIHRHVAPGIQDQIALGGDNGCVHVHIAHRCQGQGGGGTRSTPADRLVDMNVSIDPRRTGAAENRDARVYQKATQGRTGGVTARADGVIGRVDQPGAGRPLGRPGADAHIVTELDLCSRGFNKAPTATRWGRSIQRTAHLHGARLHVAHQPDRALVVLHRLRLDHAGVVHRALQQTASRLGAQQHLAAIGLDQPAVADQRIHGTGVHRDIQQAVSGHVQRHGTACRQHHGTQPGRDHAVIGHTGPEQDHMASVRTGADRALIEDGPGAWAGKFPGACHQVRVRDVQRRGHQPADID
jgi:hypothetical protein